MLPFELAFEPLFKQAASLLLWTDHHLVSIRAQIPGLLNHGADILSRNGVPHGEWRLHPSSVWMTWGLFWKAEVDLFMTSESTHWPLFFSLSHSPLMGNTLDAMLAKSQTLCIPTSEDFASDIMQNQGRERASVILITPNRINLGSRPKREAGGSALSESPSGGTCCLKRIWHPSPALWSLYVWIVCS